MYDEAQEIFDHLPIRQNEPEARYTRHLWSSFEHLTSSDVTDVQAFAIAPFHLLFMLSLQYKGIRLYQRRNVEYVVHKVVTELRSGRRQARTPKSVFDLALMSESPLAEMFSIVGAPSGVIDGIKKLVRERNDGFAHAKGAIEGNLEGKIEEYLGVLRSISPMFVEINEEIGREWLDELDADEDRDSFVEARLASEYLCHSDFNSGLLAREFS